MNSEEILALVHPRLDAEQIRVVEGFGERQRVEAGRDLFRAGDEAHDLYIVLSGVVGIIGRVDDEDELIIHHTAGELVGEFDLEATAADIDSVPADRAEGERRGVIGSPHFFTPTGNWFCPGLDIARAADGHLDVALNTERFDEFTRSCLV